MLSKETAPKRSRKLKQPKISMFLDDETNEEEEAADDAAGERHAASAGVGLTGTGSRPAQEDSYPGMFFNPEPIKTIFHSDPAQPSSSLLFELLKSQLPQPLPLKIFNLHQLLHLNINLIQPWLMSKPKLPNPLIHQTSQQINLNQPSQT